MNIVLITACVAGVAHSRMVAAAMKKEAESRGFNIAVEEQGGQQLSRPLSRAEIAKADVVIFAVAIAVMGIERFKGKKILKVSISKAIKDISGTLDSALELLQQEVG